jgi:hypothetical protein
MTADPSDPIVVALTAEEAMLVLAALRQFEPYWPADLDDLGRGELLAQVRLAIQHVRSTIATAAIAGS